MLIAEPKLLAPESLSMPAPIFVMPPAPVIAPEISPRESRAERMDAAEDFLFGMPERALQVFGVPTGDVRAERALGGPPLVACVAELGWEVEDERHLFHLAWAELRERSRLEPSTTEAFKLYVLDELPAPDVAARCGLSTDEVYGIKYRMTRKLQDILVGLRAASEFGL